MRSELNAEKIEKRFAEINSRKPEKLTPEEEASLAAAKAMDDGTMVGLEELMAQLEKYS